MSDDLCIAFFDLKIGKCRKGDRMANTTPVMRMTKRYGKTTYIVNAFCNENSGCTFEDKLLELIRNDMNQVSDVNTDMADHNATPNDSGAA